jgi:vacuolar-type H+-ATPase subunit H
MRIVVFALLGLLSLTVNGQGGVVSAPVLEAQQKTQMGFEAEERAREAARHAAKMDELIAQTDLASKHVAVAKDRLQILKDGVEKLQKINAKINDIRALERALDRQVYMIERSRSFMEGVNARGTLSLKQTSDAIDIIQEIIF